MSLDIKTKTASAKTDRADAKTLTGRLLQLAEIMPDQAAIRQKELGIYNEHTWADYADQVARFAKSLSDLGVGAGDVVSILADNDIQWVIADLAIQGLGAVACGIYPTNSYEEVAYIIAHSGSKIVVVGDQEQADKIVDAKDMVPGLERVIIIDPRGTRGYSTELLRWQDLMKRDEDDKDLRRWLASEVAECDPNAAAVLIYTSGTTGNPKGAMLSHLNLTIGADRLTDTMSATSRDMMLSYLPLCHLAEKVFTELIPLTVGSCVHFGESIETVQSDLTEVGPTIFLGVPRIWEKMQIRVDQGLRRSTKFKRFVHQKTLDAGYRALALEEAGKAPLRRKAERFFADALSHRALRKRLGMERVRVAICGGASVSPEVLRWFYAIGVQPLEVYGLTEAGVTHLVPVDAGPRIGEVGEAMTGVETMIAEDGEVLLRSGTTFIGYHNDANATAETIDAEGWLHSGDLGELSPTGRLKIVGRKKQIIITSGGKNLSPEAIENALKTSPYIAEAVALGDNRNYVAALVQIDWDAVSDWAADNQIAATSFADISSKSEVVDLIAKEIARVNERLARVEQVRGFSLLKKQLHQDDGELTPTQKVKRAAVMKIYSEQINEIYNTGARK